MGEHIPMKPDESLPVSPDTCSVLGHRYKATSPAWRGLDFSRAEIRRQSTLMVAVFGRGEAPFDLHLRVPFCHPDDQPKGWQEGMYYRVRPLMEAGRKWKGSKVASVEIAPDPERSPPWVINVRYAELRARVKGAPRRIQRSRAKGWRMPEGSIYVGRPSVWGNPFAWTYGNEGWSREAAVDEYRAWIGADEPLQIALRFRAQMELRGHDLVCWCLLNHDCHADVLLELANRDG